MNFFELLKNIFTGSYKPNTSEIVYVEGYINTEYYSKLIETYFSQYLDMNNTWVLLGIFMEITQIPVLLISWFLFLFIVFTDNEYKSLISNFKSNFSDFSLLRKIPFITFTLFTAVPIRVFINNKSNLGLNYIFFFFTFLFCKEYMIVTGFISNVTLLLIMNYGIIYSYRNDTFRNKMLLTLLFKDNTEFYNKYMNFFFVSSIGYKKLIYAFFNLFICLEGLQILDTILSMETSSVNSKLISLMKPLHMENSPDKLIKLMEIKSEIIKEDTVLLVLFDRYNPDIFNKLYLFINNLLIYLSNLPWIDYGISFFFSFWMYSLYLSLISWVFFIILIKKDYQLFNKIKIKSKKFYLLNKIFLLIFTLFIAIPNRVWIHNSKRVNVLILLGLIYFFSYLNFELLICSLVFMFYLNYLFANGYESSEKFRKITHSLLFCGDDHLASSYLKYFYGNVNKSVKDAIKIIEKNPVTAGMIGAAVIHLQSNVDRKHDANIAKEANKIAKHDADIAKEANDIAREANDIARKNFEKLSSNPPTPESNCAINSPLEQELDWESNLLRFIDNIIEVLPNNIFLYSLLLTRLIYIMWSFKWVFYFKTRGFQNSLRRKS